jgi:hypothetical protein
MKTTKERTRGKEIKHAPGRSYGLYFGALIQGENIVASGHKKLWSAVGTGWSYEKKSHEKMILVCNSGDYGKYMWCNLNTFTGSVTRYIDGNAFREVYCNGKIIHQETITIPKTKITEDIISKYQEKHSEDVLKNTIPILPDNSKSVSEYVPLLGNRVEKKLPVWNTVNSPY